MTSVSVKRTPSQGKALTVRVDTNLERRLQAAAEQAGISVSEFVREAIAQRLDRGAAESSLWDRIAPSVVRRPQAGRQRRTGDAETHAEFAAGLEAEAATTWRYLDG